MFSSSVPVGVLAAVMMLVAPARLEGQKMYWVDQSWIHRANLDGSDVERVLFDGSYPIGIALDLPAGKMYWANWSAFRIMRASLDGSNVEIVVDTGSKHPRGIALHRAAGKLYWTASATGLGGGIFRANLDGPRGTEILTDLDYVTGIGLDPEGAKIYWTETEPAPGLSRIRRANLDGSGVEDVVTGEPYAGAIALDLSDGKVYWTDGRKQQPRIRRADLDGSHIETVLVERDIPLWIALDSEAGKMYWTVRGLSATVRRANLDGSDVENLVIRGQTSPRGIALDTLCQTGGPDCQDNGLPDACDITRAISRDCDGTGIPDECEIADGFSSDCNVNGIPDTCEPDEDCNANGRQDICDLADGTSLDCNDNGVPDDCEPDEDCNHNGVQDICDIASGSSPDCDDNEAPDECQADCNRNGVADDCELECNGNRIPDECDLAHGTSLDCNANLIPDECDIDCNDNGVPDDCDIAEGSSVDDDRSGIPDECEVFTGCLSGPAYFDYAPHRESPEVEQLAMNLTGQLRAPDEVYNRILRDLRLVRLTFPETATVMGWGDYAPDHLFVRLHVDMPHAGYEALNTFYQVIADREYIGGGLHLLTFCDNVNARVLAQEYETLAEVLYAEPDSVIGDGDEVTVTPLGTVYRYMIRHAYGFDCPLGCPCSIVWVVDVGERGSVVLVSYDEFGGCRWCGLCDDCNNNGIDDPCDIACGSPLGECDVFGCGRSVDCTGNNIPDECEPDCNSNGTADSCDIESEFSRDCNLNGVPDECEPDNDCNGNGVQDICDIANWISDDCNANNVPDECEMAKGRFFSTEVAGLVGTYGGFDGVDFHGSGYDFGHEFVIVRSAWLRLVVSFNVFVECIGYLDDDISALGGCWYSPGGGICVPLVSTDTSLEGQGAVFLIGMPPCCDQQTVVAEATLWFDAVPLPAPTSLFDYASFQACFAGEDDGILPSCDPFDYDLDRDVDLIDYSILRRSLAGP